MILMITQEMEAIFLHEIQIPTRMENLSLQIYGKPYYSNAVSLLAAMNTELHLITVQGYGSMKHENICH